MNVILEEELIDKLYKLEVCLQIHIFFNIILYLHTIFILFTDTYMNFPSIILPILCHEKVWTKKNVSSILILGLSPKLKISCH